MVTRLVGESGLLYDHNISDFRFCNVKVEAIILLLLPEEQTKAVIGMSVDISRRLSEERISQWINKHITASKYRFVDIFIRSINNGRQQKQKLLII
jgi:hypothetical protein